VWKRDHPAVAGGWERDHQRPAREHGRRDALERQAIETALATVYALMTGDIAHPSDVVARDLNRWLERNKHLAQDITRRQRSPNPHDSRRR
jgi:hypothetical protein